MSKEAQAFSEAPRAKSIESSESKSSSRSDSVSTALQTDSYNFKSDSNNNFGTNSDAQDSSVTTDSRNDLDFSTSGDKQSLSNDANKTPAQKASLEFQKIMDAVRQHGSLNPQEANKRLFPNFRQVITPSDSGLESQAVKGNIVKQEYNPAERTDRLSAFRRTVNKDSETSTRLYSDRSDGLKSESYQSGTNKQLYLRDFDSAKSPGHVSKEVYSKEAKQEGFHKEYNSTLRTDGLKSHSWEKTNSSDRHQKQYLGRTDGLVSDNYLNDSKMSIRARTYDSSKTENGLISESDIRYKNNPDTSMRSKVFDPDRNDAHMSFEKTVKQGDTETVSRTFSGRSDKLSSEVITKSNNNQSKEQKFEDGKRIESSSSNKGADKETRVYDKDGKVLSINGQNARGKYTANEISDGNHKLTQRRYSDGSIETLYPEGKVGPAGASSIIDKPGSQPKYFDSKGKELTVDSASSESVLSTINDNGTVFERLSNGESRTSELKDFVSSASPEQLISKSSELTGLTTSLDQDTSKAAIDGLFKSTASEVPLSDDSPSPRKTLIELANHPQKGSQVQESASKNLESKDPQTRIVASEVMAARISNWNDTDISAITKNPSTELANQLSILPKDKIGPHTKPIYEGLEPSARFDASEAPQSIDSRIASIGVVASVGGKEALSALGYNVKESGNQSSIETKDGTKLLFDQTENNRLRLRSAETNGQLKGDRRTQNFDASTGEISSVSKKDPFGQYSETVYTDTENGEIAQRKYSGSNLVRTVLSGANVQNPGQPVEVHHQKGKAPVSIDAQGNKQESPTDSAIPLGTSFEDPQNLQTIFSDGKLVKTPIDKYVAQSEPKDLVKHQKQFEKHAQLGSKTVSSSSVDALSKIYTAELGDHSNSARDSLRSLSKNGKSETVTKSILKSTSGRDKLTRESNNTNKAIGLIANTAGYDGLAHAGLKVDKQANSAQLDDGTKYNFEQTKNSGLRLKGFESSDGKRQVDYSYDKNGKFEGSVEKLSVNDSTNTSDLKYENIKLPPLKKGWGPYQALEQLRSEGKIEMTNSQMKETAERIRDREFKKLGRNYFKVGESFDMYSPEELKNKGVGKDSKPGLAIHRDADGKVTQLDRANNTSVKVEYNNGKPAKISDGLGPSIVSRDGVGWVPEGAPKGAPKFEGQIDVDKESGALQIKGKKGTISLEPDGTRVHTAHDGKKTILFRPKPISDNRERQSDGSDRPNSGDNSATRKPVVREFSDRSKFFKAQNDSTSCSAFSMAMMASDHLSGKPVTTKEAHNFKKLAGTTSHGYRGSLNDMSKQLESVGLNTKVHSYDKFDAKGMADLNSELDKGHTAVARVVNDRTGNRHYIYIAGRDSKGNYIVGDPDRRNKNNSGPVSPERLMKLMSKRTPAGGFVSGWAKETGAASKIEGTAAYEMAQAKSLRDTGTSRGLNNFRPGSDVTNVDVADKRDSRDSSVALKNGRRLEILSSHTAKSSSYFPYNNKMEGGHYDRKGKRLRTLQDYLAGKADYVSVAMDTSVAPYGSRIRIPELEQKYGREIEFRLVDTGSAFKNKGTSRIDICTKTRRDTYERTINGKLTVQFVKEVEGKPPRTSPKDNIKEVDENSEISAFKGGYNQIRLKGGLRPVVVLDSGHGGHDPGAVVQGTQEKTVVNDMTGRVAEHLKAMGIVVERSNPKGNFKALSQRSSFANRALGETQQRKSSDRHMADAFISIHANHDGRYYKGGGKARGFQTYYSRSKAADGTSELAESIHSAVTDAGRNGQLDVKDSGVKKHANFHVIRRTKPPAVLLEAGFLTNDRDRANLNQPKYREKMAQQIALGIANYLYGREPKRL